MATIRKIEKSCILFDFAAENLRILKKPWNVVKICLTVFAQKLYKAFFFIL